MRWFAAILAAVVVLLFLLAPETGAQDTGWTIERFHSEITIERDATLTITEAIDVDFGALEKHGIYREIPVRYAWPDNKRYERVYGLDVISVTNADGRAWPYTRERNGANVRIRIGDPDRTVSGRQSYRITYRVGGALNTFETHDELYWNVNGGEWSVPTLAASATVRLAGGGLERAACFEGYAGITDPCTVRTAGGQLIPQQSTQPNAGGVPLPADTAELTYTATAPFEPREQLTIVAAIRKGAVDQPAVILEEKPRDPTRFFETRNPLTVGGTALLAAAGLGLLVANWWKGGRDRRYTTIHYLTENPEEETRPLFQSHPVVVEFEPPEGIKPAQAGLLIDEKADTLDVTATIVDLAVRGYLTIEEIPKTWLPGSKDWRLTRKRADTDGLEAYERIILVGLFDDGDEVTLSSLKNEYYKDLQRAQKALYSQATERRWFSGNPETRRTLWGVGAVVLIVAGVGLTVALGYFFGAGLLGLPIALLGIALLISSRSMAQRTAQGSELLRRVLGFRRYIVTAEKNQQQFNERANIFAEYLPYAIVFGVVDRWASAFREIDASAAVAAWYVGSGGFNAPRLSRDLQSFSSTVSSAIASTPGGSGGSGFSGAAAGGGGGGGGGGSW